MSIEALKTSRVGRVAFAGTPAFAVPSLQALIAAHQADEIELVAVYTQPDRPAGRGKMLLSSPVKQAAEAAGIPIFQPQSLKKADAKRALRALDIDLLVVTAYGLILPLSVLEMPRLGCVNVHASLLPRWRGAAPIQRAIQAGDNETGITLMQMDAGLDTGDMLATARCAIAPDDTGGSLHDRLAALGGELLAKHLPDLLQQTLSPQPQDGAKTSYAGKLDKAEARLDWRKPAVELHNTIRAFNPFPVATTLHHGTLLRIHASEVVGEAADGTAGKITQIDKSGISVCAGKGALKLTQLQKPGGKPLAARDFLNGYALEVGERFE